MHAFGRGARREAVIRPGYEAVKGNGGGGGLNHSLFRGFIVQNYLRNGFKPPVKVRRPGHPAVLVKRAFVSKSSSDGGAVLRR